MKTKTIKALQNVNALGTKELDEAVVRVLDKLRNEALAPPETELALMIFKCHLARNNDFDRTMLILKSILKYCERYEMKRLMNYIENTIKEIENNEGRI